METVPVGASFTFAIVPDVPDTAATPEISVETSQVMEEPTSACTSVYISSVESVSIESARVHL